MENLNRDTFLKQYVTERLPLFVPGIFEGAPDQPHFTVDQRYIPPSANVATV
jgi:hypothetical protein